MTAQPQVEFGKWRSFFWPIYRFELKKFIPMLAIFFLISFNYNLLRAFKDSLIVTAKDSGAEAIPFIKVWVILPMAILLTFIFTRLANRFTREKVFYIMMTGFVSFFFIFAFILYPAREFLHPHDLADKLQLLLPSGCRGLIALFRNWTFTLFYTMSELWSTAILTVLFWGFTNEVTSVQEARRFYGILATGANIAQICSGQVSIFLSQKLFIPQLPYGKESWEQSILFLNCAVIASGVLSIILFRWLNKHVILPHERIQEQTQKSEKIKMSMRKNFAYLAKSKYLLCIALIVLTYNIAVNLIEIVWKNQIKLVYPDPGMYNAYMGEVLTATGIIATVVSILLTTNIIRRFSWTYSALIPPVITLITGAFFFFFTVFPNINLMGITAFLSVSPLYLSVTFGSLQNCLTRASKYTLYDATKELAFIPLSKESKLKGKAAIDGVGSRLGKSGGSVIHQGFLILFTTLAVSTPYIAIVFVGVVVIWIMSVVSLGKQFDELVTSKTKLDIPEPEAKEPSPTLSQP
jgi:AAA family ATP:ADP antiporter